MWLNVFNSIAYVLTFMVITVNNSSFLYLHWKLEEPLLRHMQYYDKCRTNSKITFSYS